MTKKTTITKKEISDRRLMSLAKKAAKKSYSPYSHFAVGAALLTADDEVFTGCNIENASFTPSVCAERVAVFSAVSKGITEFKKLAIVGYSHGEIKGFAYPCGVCRQVLREFCDLDFPVIVTDGKSLRKYTLGELLPESFTKDDM